MAIIAFTWIITVPVPGQAAPTTPQLLLSKGNQWTIRGVTYRSASGNGSDTGTWTRESNYTDKYLVTSRNATAIKISWSGAESWSTTANYSWVAPNGGSTKSGKRYYGTSYTIDLTTYTILAVSSKSHENEVGSPAWFLLDLAGIVPGGTVMLDWSTPNSDSRLSTPMPVSWNVRHGSVNFKGKPLSAWKVSHEGELLGWWHCQTKPSPLRHVLCTSGDVYSKGLGTEIDYFDSVYGIRLRYSISGSFLFNRIMGGWTETVSNVGQITGTNISFSLPRTMIVPGNFTVVVDGTAYNEKKAFTWAPGSTHTITINESIQGPLGVRYVFLKWSDGSNETSRTITASSTSKTYSALFKTQYELLVVSDLGNPNGTGWYDKGTEATFSVDSPQPEMGLLGLLGGKIVFQSWTGNSTGTSSASKILMDGPKTVQANWVADDSQAYTLLGEIAVVVIIAIVLAVTVLTRRGQSRIQQPHPS